MVEDMLKQEAQLTCLSASAAKRPV